MVPQTENNIEFFYEVNNNIYSTVLPEIFENNYFLKLEHLLKIH